jgi:hypothetical protein
MTPEEPSTMWGEPRIPSHPSTTTPRAPGARQDAPAYLPATDMGRFVREVVELVELGDADAAAIRRTAPLVLGHAETLTAGLYEHFLRFPATARFFLREDGTPDAERIERRKHSLGRWLTETAQAAVTKDLGYFLLTLGLAHSHRAHGPGGPVPAHLMVGAMSFVQTAVARLIHAELGAGPDAAEAAAAWNKLLLVHLDVLLLGYLAHRPPP